jgi:hypothetical protein
MQQEKTKTGRAGGRLPRNAGKRSKARLLPGWLDGSRPDLQAEDFFPVPATRKRRRLFVFFSVYATRYWTATESAAVVATKLNRNVALCFVDTPTPERAAAAPARVPLSSQWFASTSPVAVARSAERVWPGQRQAAARAPFRGQRPINSPAWG